MDVNLQKSQAWKTPSLQILSSISLILISFFFIFWAGSFFEADIFPLENRAIYYTTFHVYVFDKQVDTVIITLLTVLWFSTSLFGKKRIAPVLIFGSLTAAALLTNFDPLLDALVLISIPLIISFFIFNHFSSKKILSIHPYLLKNFFSFSVLCIAVSGLILTLLAFSSTFELPVWIKNHSYAIFLLLSSFSPALIIFLVVGSIIKLLTIRGGKKSKNRNWNLHISPQKIKRNSKFLFLSFFILLSIFFALLPHQSFINNEQELVGADTIDYVNLLNNIWDGDQSGLMYRAFVVQNSGDRPISLLLFSGVFTIFPENPYQGIDHLPLILSPILVLTVFFLTRELTSNDKVALLASFLTAISFQPLIGIYSGLYANWLALILGYASIIFLLRFLKRPTGINYLVFSVLFFLMMFSHVYTWTLLTIFLGLFLIVSSWLKIFDRKRAALIFLIILASIAFDAGKSIMTEANSGLERDVSIAGNKASYENLTLIWSNLSQTSLVYAAGIFGNFLILSLCIYWLFRSNIRDIPNLFIAIFLSIGFLPILFGGEIILSRVLFNIPFQIPAGIGLYYLAYSHKSNLLVLAISIWILSISLQTITNFI